MHSSSSASSADPEHYLRLAAAAEGHAAVDAGANGKEPASSVPGSPPRMLEHRENARFIEGSGMEVDDAQDNSSSRGQKRTLDLSGDMNKRDSPPKFRRVDRDDGQAAPGSASLTESAIAIDPLPWNGPRVEQLGSEGNTPLHLAARHGDTEAVRSLLALGVRADQVNGDGNMPLHLAAFNGHAEAVALLLQAGAPFDQPDDDGDTPLHLAACDGSIEVVRLLLAANAKVDQVNDEDSTPLHLAVFNGYAEKADLLIKAGASLHQPDGDGEMPLHLAARKGHAKAVDVLIKAGAPVNQPDRLGDMPLHRASFKGYVETVDLLLKAGAQVNLPSRAGSTPLHLATFNGHAEAVDLLLKAGAHVNQPGGNGNMPLHRAARTGSAETVRLLLAHGANRNHVNDAGNAPLHLATIYAHAEVADLLLKGGAQLNQLDGDGDTALHLAASGGAVEIMRYLLAAGAWIDPESREGNTPLHLAASNGHAGAVDLLLKAGAGPQVRQPNGEGNTPLSLAFANSHANVVRLLLPARTEIRCRNLAAGPPGPYKNMISGASLVDDDLLNALESAIREVNVPMVELSLAHGVMSLPDKPFLLKSPAAFPFPLPTPLPFPIHDLLLCGPPAASASLAVAADMMDTLATIFEASSTAQMTPEEMDDALREAGLLSPVIDELTGQFCWAVQLKQAMAGNAPLTRAQIRQAIGGMLGELEQCMINRPLPFRAPDRRTAFEETAFEDDEPGIGTPAPWLSEEGQAYLTRSLEKQVQALAEMGRQREADELGEGVSDLLALCLTHMPSARDDHAAALRHVLTAKLGMYGPLADRTVQAWLATLAKQAEGSVAGVSIPGTFAQLLRAQLGGAATYSQVRSSSAIDEAAAQIMTQLMLRQWTMLEQYWNGAAAGAIQ